MYADFEEPRSRDRDLGTLKFEKKTAIFVSNLLIRL